MISARSACTQNVSVGYDVGAGTAAAPPKRSITTGPATPAGASWIWATWGRASPAVSVSGPTDQHTSSWPGFNVSSIDPRSASPCGLIGAPAALNSLAPLRTTLNGRPPSPAPTVELRTPAPMQSPTTTKPIVRTRPLVTARPPLCWAVGPRLAWRATVQHLPWSRSASIAEPGERDEDDVTFVAVNDGSASPATDADPRAKRFPTGSVRRCTRLK